MIRTAKPDLLDVQEIGDEQSLAAPQRAGRWWDGGAVHALREPHTIRVGWLSPGGLSEVEEVVDLPAALCPVKVADDGTTLAQLGRGALAVTYTTAGRTRSEHSARI